MPSGIVLYSPLISFSDFPQMKTTQCHEQTQKPDDKNPSGGAAKIRQITKHNEFNNAQKSCDGLV